MKKKILLSFLKKIEPLYITLKVLRSLRTQYSSQMFGVPFGLFIFISDYLKYSKENDNTNFLFHCKYIEPYFREKTQITEVNYVYFYQDTWFARNVSLNMPSQHYDIGSKVDSMGIISQFIPVTIVDIRGIDVNLPNFNYIKGSILHLPFNNDSIESLSSLCVLEHIGLGRYGDPIDPWGSEKAIKEITRVVKPSGDVYISVPVDRQNRVYFNGFRSFTRSYILKLFSLYNLIDERYLYGKQMHQTYNEELDWGTGMFHFRKKREAS